MEQGRDVPEGTQLPQPPQPPVDRMERMERILEGLLGVMNQQTHNQPPPLLVMGVPIAPEPPRAELISIKNFQKMKPPVFGGGIDPSRADDWKLGMEKIFAVMTPAQYISKNKSTCQKR